MRDKRSQYEMREQLAQFERDSRYAFWAKKLPDGTYTKKPDNWDADVEKIKKAEESLGLWIASMDRKENRGWNNEKD